MYHEIQRLLREGYRISQIANHLVADPRTVKKYAVMTEMAYEAFLLKRECKIESVKYFV